jgi:CheY-like chemotaxis protein
MASVLIVEDDAALREVYADALADEGYEVLVASEGREALAMLEDGPAAPCVVLLDLRMPGMSGWELAGHMRRSARWQGLPIVVVAAHYLLAEEARRLGASAWLQKPVTLSSLVGAVERACTGEDAS